MKKLVIAILLVIVLGVGAYLAFGRPEARPNLDPTGSTFPSVTGTSLAGKEIELPASVAGKAAVFLVGYVQKAQFDGDRWLLGLLQAGLDVQIYELPTIEGLLPGMFAGSIDEGMRRGIQEEDWASVVTIYEDAEKIVAITGNEKPNNMRVFLLDDAGKIAWFHDRGFSAGKLIELQEKLKALGSAGDR